MKTHLIDYLWGWERTMFAQLFDWWCRTKHRDTWWSPSWARDELLCPLCGRSWIVERDAVVRTSRGPWEPKGLASIFVNQLRESFVRGEFEQVDE